MASVIIYFSFIKLTENRELDSLEDMGERLLDTAETNNLSAVEMRPFYQSFIPDDGMIRILDRKGTIIYRAADDEELFDLPVHQAAANQSEIIRYDGNMIAVFSTTIYQGNEMIGIIELFKSLDDRIEEIEILFSILIGVSFLLVVLAIFFGKWTARVFLRPLSVIGATMDNIQKDGRFEKIKISTHKRDEITHLAKNFNSMIDTLEVMFQKQEQFISDASHELKTPLTVIESYASMLQRWGKDDEELLKEGICVIQDESKRLQHLVAQLLDLATINQKSFQLEKVNITEICKSTAKRLQVANNRKILYESSSSDPVFGLFSQEKLIQVIIILLDNALKYSEKDVKLRIEADNGGPKIQIIDQGVGIPKEEINRLFERFYRVDKSRTRATGGSGLGLTIANSIVQQAGGNIFIESELHKGTIVTIALKSS
jgi:signal transduction histidine kinase